MVAMLLEHALGTPIITQDLKATVTLTIPKETAKANVYDWSEGWKPSFNIHQSCNSTLRAQLQQGLDEAVQVAQHARDHLLRWGNRSEFTQKYFGNSSSATPIGWYDRIIAADKTGMLFRCDDPDRNCETQKSKPSINPGCIRSHELTWSAEQTGLDTGGVAMLRLRPSSALCPFRSVGPCQQCAILGTQSLDPSSTPTGPPTSCTDCCMCPPSARELTTTLPKTTLAS